jgi:hypothetical protein
MSLCAIASISVSVRCTLTSNCALQPSAAGRPKRLWAVRSPAAAESERWPYNAPVHVATRISQFIGTQRIRRLWTSGRLLLPWDCFRFARHPDRTWSNDSWFVILKLPHCRRTGKRSSRTGKSLCPRGRLLRLWRRECTVAAYDLRNPVLYEVRARSEVNGYGLAEGGGNICHGSKQEPLPSRLSC